MSTVVMFPGQGSQRKGMGEELFDEFPRYVAEADALLGYSIRELCLQDPQGRLRDTRYTQPALFVVNALLWFWRIRTETVPAFLMGHSLGEYNALLAGGALDFRTGLRLLQKRGALMAQAQGGGMAAVIGMAPEAIERTLKEHALTSLDIANYNSPRQTVISGPAEEVRRAESSFRSAGLMYIPLPVSAAFHSRYMREAGNEFIDFLQSAEVKPPQIPVITNCTARPYPPSAAGVRDLLGRQIVSPVRWYESVSWALRQGATEFVELGPGNVLTTLVKEIRKTPLPA